MHGSRRDQSLVEIELFTNSFRSRRNRTNNLMNESQCTNAQDNLVTKSPRLKETLRIRYQEIALCFFVTW